MTDDVKSITRKLSKAFLSCWVAFLLVASFWPPGARMPGVLHVLASDSLAHAAGYAVLAGLLLWALLSLPPARRLIAATVTACLFGLVAELIQPLVGRKFDVLDLAANAAGIGIVVGLVWLCLALTARRTRSKNSGFQTTSRPRRKRRILR